MPDPRKPRTGKLPPTDNAVPPADFAATPARSESPAASPPTVEEQRYLDLMRAVQAEWDTLEATGDSSVQLSGKALSTIKESVRADARRGAPVDMPPTDAGPFTVSELALRTLVRRAVDSIPGALSLRNSFDHGEGTLSARGVPVRVAARISADHATPDLPALADGVRAAVLEACEGDLGLDDVFVDIHIEDLHGY